LVAALFLALIVTLAVFRLPVGPSLALIWQGGLGDAAGLSRTAVKATPLLLAALGMVVAWRAGMYNIGGEGQLLMGALLGACVAKFGVPLGIPGLAGWLLILVVSMIGGALWATVASWLAIRRGVEVVIGTILLNFVAVQLLNWAVAGPLQEVKHTVPLTDALPDAWMLPKLNRQLDVNLGSVIALLLAVAVYFFLFRSVKGYQLRLVGESPRAARAYRISPTKAKYLAMAWSGALCGLAGGLDYAGVAGQLGNGFSQQWGFLAIPVALLGALHPLGVIPSAIYFGALFAGSENLARFTPAGTTIVFLIQGAAVLTFVAVQSIRRQPSTS
jgi:general nucleoside transport system permease protein